MRDDGARECVSEPRSKTFLTGRTVTKFFMPDRGHGILNGVLYDMLSEGGANALPKAFETRAPLVRAVSQLLDSCAATSTHSGSCAEGIFYVLGAVWVLSVFSGLRRHG